MQTLAHRVFLRSAWFKVHVYLALSIGLFLALIGLTGSLSIYREEIDIFLNPQLMIERPQGKYQSLDKMIAAVKAVHPDRYGVWTLEMPRISSGMVTAWYDKPRETFFELYAPLMVSVNPYTAEVVASRFWGQTVSTWLLDLHTQLRFGRWGWNVVGILGLLLIISITTGFYLWWPGLNRIWSSIIVRYHDGMIQLVFDLHRVIGLLSTLALLLLASTGFLLSNPSVLEALSGAPGMVHGETGRNITSTAIPNNHPASLAAAAFVAQGPYPRAQLRRVSVPVGDTGIYRINLRQTSEINKRHPFTTVWVDRWSGQIKEVRDPTRFSQSETFSTWIWPLHTGEALGDAGRFVWFLAGQSLFLLYISGLLRWLYKRGLVKDRDINLSRLRVYVYEVVKLAGQLGIRLFNMGCRLLKALRPYLFAAYTHLLFWLHGLWLKRVEQHRRIDKK